jgi:hypothetical protein
MPDWARKSLIISRVFCHPASTCPAKKLASRSYKGLDGQVCKPLFGVSASGQYLGTEARLLGHHASLMQAPFAVALEARRCDSTASQLCPGTASPRLVIATLSSFSSFRLIRDTRTKHAIAITSSSNHQEDAVDAGHEEGQGSFLSGRSQIRSRGNRTEPNDCSHECPFVAP